MFHSFSQKKYTYRNSFFKKKNRLGVLQMKKDLEKTEIPQKLLIIIRGLPSSGKSTLAKMLAAGSEGETLCSDDYMTTEDGAYVFNKQNFIEAHKLCQLDCESLMQKEVSPVILHNNMGEAWEAEYYFQLAEKYGYSTMVTSLYDAGLNDTSLSNRSIHKMPQHLIQKVRQKWDIDIHPHRQKKQNPQATTLQRFHD